MNDRSTSRETYPEVMGISNVQSMKKLMAHRPRFDPSLINIQAWGKLIFCFPFPFEFEYYKVLDGP